MISTLGTLTNRSRQARHGSFGPVPSDCWLILTTIVSKRGQMVHFWSICGMPHFRRHWDPALGSHFKPPRGRTEDIILRAPTASPRVGRGCPAGLIFRWTFDIYRKWLRALYNRAVVVASHRTRVLHSEDHLLAVQNSKLGPAVCRRAQRDCIPAPRLNRDLFMNNDKNGDRMNRSYSW